MKKTILLTLAVVMLVALPLGSAFGLERLVASTELVQYDSTKAYNGYTIFTPFNQPGPPYHAFMIDMEGNLVHAWEHDISSFYGYLLPNGNLMAGMSPAEAAAADTYRLLTGGGRQGMLREVAWDSTVAWSKSYYSTDYGQHHDFQKIWNAELGEYTYIFIACERESADDALALGADPANLSSFQNGWGAETIVEMNSNGEVIWLVRFADHIVQNYDPTKTADFTDVCGRSIRGATYGEPEDYPEKLDINWTPPKGDWLHCNSLDYNAELGQIVTNSVTGQFWVFDHDGTFIPGDPEGSMALTRGPAGDFLFRWGNPCWYSQGTCPYVIGNGTGTSIGTQQIGGSHDIQWIRPTSWDGGPALPGAGNFLIFNNGGNTGTYSEIFEIDPWDNGQYGVYLPEVEAGYTASGGFMGPSVTRSNQVVWNYKSAVPNGFYAMHISGCTRMPNGNTVICSGTQGHMFEVTEAGEVVWEYQNPVIASGATTTQTDVASMGFSVFRCYRYGPDFPGLAGKDLTPMGTLTGRISGTDDYPDPVIYNGIGFGSGMTTSAGGFY
jgi:hypothetical protein